MQGVLKNEYVKQKKISFYTKINKKKKIERANVNAQEW